MDTPTLIAIYVPIFIMFLLLFVNNNQQKHIMQINQKRRKQKENRPMDYQLVKTYEGKYCIITTSASSFGSIQGTITKVTDGWIEVDNPKSTELLNLDYISSIKSIKAKSPKNA